MYNYEQKYNIKIFETSAKTGININRSFNYPFEKTQGAY